MPYRTTPVVPPAAGEVARPPQPPILGDTLARVNGHVLVPERAGTVAGHPVNPTAYVGDELLVQGRTEGEAMAALVEAATRTGQRLAPSTAASGKRQAYVDALSDRALAEVAERVWVTRLRLTPPEDPRAPRPDAWSVLQAYRELVGPQEQELTVGLNHLVTLAGGPTITGEPYITGPATTGTPYITGPATSGLPYITGPAGGGLPYITGPGALGNRQPVTWLGELPAPTVADLATRRPVVAVLDTGLGQHDWLVAPHAVLGAQVGGESIGLGSDVVDAELLGVRNPLAGDLDLDAGHGTFIAGIVRQICPEAQVLAIRVMPSGGVVDEHQLTIALNKLLVRQARAQLLGHADELVDVLNLSLGFYHETPDDVAFSGVLGGTLDQLGRLGVAVVAAAGNDASSVPMFPAGLASRQQGADEPGDRVPLLAVGALNPSGSIAIFSNAGPWVSCHRPGANVVSTLPTTFNGSLQPQLATADGRSSIDPDNYSGGFGIWSGTSFAAPVLAAELACELARGGALDGAGAAAAVDRGWAAVSACVGWRRP
ncbi:S8 family peptidase [Lapillicoccus jejuensis]|uniref:Subtilase family protein n=1 Tax=Lapillicoccus jejuensis TaxID=402171 RepID=A0A542DYF7_9MICO|nr:S8 family serine peptidase [Lapillicoccus jejuensis]TQJ08089.1 subtilase family protein [Lapillicoccus jejuensis]